MPKNSRKLARRNEARALQAARRLVPALERDLAITFVQWAKPILHRHGLTPDVAPPEQVYKTARVLWNRVVLEQRDPSRVGPLQLPRENQVNKAIGDLLAARAHNLQEHPWLMVDVGVKTTDDGRHQLHVVSELSTLVPMILHRYAQEMEVPLPPADDLEKDWILEACRRVVSATTQTDDANQPASV